MSAGLLKRLFWGELEAGRSVENRCEDLGGERSAAQTEDTEVQAAGSGCVLNTERVGEHEAGETVGETEESGLSSQGGRISATWSRRHGRCRRRR